MNPTLHTSAELFIASGCSHCPIVLNELSERVKSGQLATLDISNIAVDTHRAEKYNVRSVPWFSLQNNSSFMIFNGDYTPKEIQHWLNISKQEDAMKEYIEYKLGSGKLMTIMQIIQLKPDMFSYVIEMLKDEDTSMDIRIGLDALTENLSSENILQQYANEFKSIASTDNIRLQIDALHYLALTGDINNKAFLLEKAKDKNTQIKEAAEEALETLADLITE